MANLNSAFKMQLQAMFIDTSLNSVERVLANLHQGFLEAAVRCEAYVRSLNRVRPTHEQLLISELENPQKLPEMAMMRCIIEKDRASVVYRFTGCRSHAELNPAEHH